MDLIGKIVLSAVSPAYTNNKYKALGIASSWIKYNHPFHQAIINKAIDKKIVYEIQQIGCF